MEYIEVDKTTKQVLSAGLDLLMYEGEIIEVPELPQRADTSINICDYYWDGTQFVYRPEGNIHKIRTVKELLDCPFNKNLIKLLEENFHKQTGELRTVIKDKLDTDYGLKSKAK